MCSYSERFFMYFCSHVHLPVLPQGLQIMADQGFEHRLQVIVLPKANQPQISHQMRRFVFSYVMAFIMCKISLDF